MSSIAKQSPGKIRLTISSQTTRHTGVQTDKTERSDDVNGSSFWGSFFTGELSHQLQSDLDNLERIRHDLKPNLNQYDTSQQPRRVPTPRLTT